MDRWFVNNELNNGPAAIRPVAVPDAELDFDSPFGGSLVFTCVNADHYAQICVYLTARMASALMDNEGGRVYLRAPERMPQPDTFPCRVTIRVEVVDDPGPAIIG